MTNNDTPDVPIEAPPAARIAHAVERLGEDEVVSRSIALLAGLNAGEEFLLYVGGIHAQGILDGAPALYWPEVWGARALMYAWNDTAADAVEAGLGNQAWRVREMSAKVVGARGLPFTEQITPLLTDEVARVRAQAARTLGDIAADASVIEVLNGMLKDPDIEVRRQVGASLKAVRSRVPAATDEAAPAEPEVAPDTVVEDTVVERAEVEGSVVEDTAVEDTVVEEPELDHTDEVEAPPMKPKGSGKK